LKIKKMKWGRLGGNGNDWKSQNPEDSVAASDGRRAELSIIVTWWR
jgi:hypothetical protein